MNLVVGFSWVELCLPRPHPMPGLHQVEVVGIASPRVGDHEFSGFYREHVNGRTPSFLGEGLRLRPQPTFEIGDVVVQVSQQAERQGGRQAGSFLVLMA